MRLITFGDSYTHGHWLPNQELESWPAQLGSLLECEVINKAHPGASNIEILTEILTFKFNYDDLVIVGWTFIERDLIYKKQTLFNKVFNRKEHIPVSAWVEHDVSKQWLLVHNDFDLAVRAGLYINHAELYLDSLKLKHYGFLTQPLTNKMPNWIRPPMHIINDIKFERIDYAQDNKHPGIKSHQLVAKNLYAYINK